MRRSRELDRAIAATPSDSGHRRHPYWLGMTTTAIRERFPRQWHRSDYPASRASVAGSPGRQQRNRSCLVPPIARPAIRGNRQVDLNGVRCGFPNRRGSENPTPTIVTRAIRQADGIADQSSKNNI